MILDAKQNEKPAKLTIKSNTDKGTIYLEVPCDIPDYGLQESMEKLSKQNVFSITIAMKF